MSPEGRGIRTPPRDLYTLPEAFLFLGGGDPVTEERAKRKLTAILSADVKGYSRLMADDEEATVGTINAYREVMTGFIKDNRGGVVDAKGDNVLAEFSSVVDALRCAVEVQNELKERNSELPEQRRMDFRIGINLGDVIEEEGTIYGDGVNVAARLEGLAEGAGICISGTAFDQVKNRVSVGYEYQGKRSVKNIPDPVRVYKVLLEPEAAGKIIDEKEPRPIKGLWMAIAAVVILAAIGGLVWHFYVRPDIEPASVERMAFPLPDKPSIAVLPFVNMSDDPKQGYFSDGITEEIITALSKTPKMLIIARNSTFSYKGKAAKVQQIAEELGVRYVLEGSVRKSDDRVRITAQLIDALKGHYLWSERYDRDLKDIFKLHDEITKKIITALQVELTEGEQARVSAKGTEHIDAYLKCVEGREHLFRFNKEENLLARQKAEEAIALDPNYSDAYSLLGKTHILDVWFKWSESPKESMGHAFELAKKAIALKEDNYEAHRILSHIYLLKRQHDAAIAECELAVKMAPNAADCIYNLGLVLRFSGRAEEAIPVFEKAIRLNPIPPPSYLYQLGLTQAFIGEFDKAIALCKRALPQNPDDLVGRITLALAYSSLGLDEAARREAVEVLRIDPNFTLAYASKTWPYKSTDDRDLVLNALRKAGLPETPALPLPDKPSIAVLPFVNMSGNPEQEYFSDGITEEIITGLAKVPDLFVIARNSTFTYKGKPVKVRQVALELGVRYVLEGSVRKAGSRVRITAQLIEAKTGKHLWAERYDRDFKDIFALQDEITLKVITALRVKLTEGEQARLIGKGTKNLEAYAKVLQARKQFYRMNKQGSMESRRLAREAIALDSEYAVPYTILALTHMMDLWFKFSKSPKESMRLAVEAAQKALALDDSDPATHIGLCMLYIMQRQHDKAIAAGERAVLLSPSGARAHSSLGTALMFAGRSNEAIQFIQKAITLNPFPPSIYLRNLGSAYRMAGRNEEAIVEYKKSLQKNPDDLFTHLGLATAYVSLGLDEEARAEAVEVLRIYPKFSLEYYAKTLPLRNQADVDYIISSLRKTGLK